MEDFSKYINQTDPTKPIDNIEVSLEDQYTKLTEEEKIILGAKILFGMKSHIPVDIKTFLFDEYFLGVDQITKKGTAVFPYWVDKLEEIFPNPLITKYPYILLSGE